MADLDALSREIAETSDAWITPGVSGVTPDGTLWRRANNGWFDDDDLPAFEDEGDDEDGTRYLVSETHDIRPNLTDGATVNSLLGDGMVWEYGACGDALWVAHIGIGACRASTRTEAICRAWIAANRGSK